MRRQPDKSKLRGKTQRNEPVAFKTATPWKIKTGMLETPRLNDFKTTWWLNAIRNIDWILDLRKIAVRDITGSGGENEDGIYI